MARIFLDPSGRDHFFLNMHAIKPLHIGWIGALVFTLVWMTTDSRLLSAAQSDSDELVRVHFLAARQAEKSGDLAKAVSEYQAVLKLRPDEPVVYNNLGLVYHLQLKYREAIAAFQRALKLNPELLGANLFLGIDFYRTNQSEKALAPLKNAIVANPNDVQAHLYLGRCYLDLARYEEALQEVQKAVKLAPKDADALYTLGQVYGKLMGAAYLKMAEVDPDSYRVYQVLAESYDSQKDMEKAIDAYKKAITRKPGLPGLHYGLGDVYWRAGRVDEGLKEFQEELKLNPENYMAIWKIGNLYMLKSSWDEAIPYLEKAILLAPSLAQAHRDLGKAYFQKNELEKAMRHYQKVIELDPEEDTSHYRLAAIYKRQGRTQEAQAEMKIFETLAKKVKAAQNPLLPGLRGSTESEREQIESPAPPPSEPVQKAQ
jgi:tetratricopeptide (TPR) repeat protein